MRLEDHGMTEYSQPEAALRDMVTHGRSDSGSLSKEECAIIAWAVQEIERLRAELAAAKADMEQVIGDAKMQCQGKEIDRLRAELADLESKWGASNGEVFALALENTKLRAELATAKAEPVRPASREPTKCPHCSRISHYSLLRESYVCALCGPWQSKPS
jgi:regulator of replication initiation timing